MKRSACKRLAEKEESSTSHPKIQKHLKVICSAGAKHERCVVISMPCLPAKSDAMPMLKCSGRPEAKIVSKSAGTDEKTQKHMDHISEQKRIRVRFQFRYGAGAHRHDRCDERLDAEAAVDEEWDTLHHLLAGNFKEVKPESEVVQQARKDGRSVHFASLLDLCHLKHLQTYKGERCASGAHRQRRQWIQSRIRAARSFSDANGREQDSRIQFPESMAWEAKPTQFRRSFGFYPGAPVGSSKIAVIARE